MHSRCKNNIFILNLTAGCLNAREQAAAASAATTTGPTSGRTIKIPDFLGYKAH